MTTPANPSQRAWSWRRLLTAPIRGYKRWISPWLPPACRFEPTCALYAIEAIETHGMYGCWLAMLRILKCQPFHPGGFDPVPPRRQADHSNGSRAPDENPEQGSTLSE